MLPKVYVSLGCEGECYTSTRLLLSFALFQANLDGLQELAFENLRSQLTPGNVIAEVFSKFSGQYVPIRFTDCF